VKNLAIFFLDFFKICSLLCKNRKFFLTFFKKDLYYIERRNFTKEVFILITFDSIVLYPSYSEIKSRSEVNPNSLIIDKSKLPIINANMISLYSRDFISLLESNNIFTSIPRIGLDVLKESIAPSGKNSNGFDINSFISIGTKKSDYNIVSRLYCNGYNRFLVDVNHGHHSMVKDMLYFLRKDIGFNGLIMAGNVSSIEGIEDLFAWGVDIVKVGNSFGSACSTLIKTGFGVHGFHVCKEFTDRGLKDSYSKYNKYICLDGGIRCVGDIAKALIYSDMVMVGKLFAGTTESGCEFANTENTANKLYFGNASAEAKRLNGDKELRYVEGKTIEIPHTGSVVNLIKDIQEGLQSAYSFVGAKNLEEYQQKARKCVMEV